MDSMQIVRMGMEEFYEDLTRALEGLTPEERRFQPGVESHHIDFTVWHMARVEDNWVQVVARDKESVWSRDGWDERWGIPATEGGYGYSAEQVRDLPRFDLSDIVEYYESVRRETFAYLESLSEDDLDRVVDRGYGRSVAIGWIFSHLIVELAQHTGQVAYLRGMQRGLDG